MICSKETSATLVPSREEYRISPPMTERDFRKRRSARRYGSIRVEECSFVEQDGSPSQLPLPSSTNYAFESDLHPLKRVYIDKSSMVPRNIKEPYSSSKQQCNNPEHEHGLIKRDDLGQRNCQRHNNEIYTQSNPGAASRNFAPIHYHYSCDVEPKPSSKLHRTFSSDKCSAMYPTSPTEDNFHINQSISQSHARQQQGSTTAGVRRYKDLEHHQHSSHIYETRNETGTHLYQRPSYSSNSYGNQSRDYLQQRHFHPYSSNQKEKALDTLHTEASLRLDFLQHARGRNRSQHYHHFPQHSSSFESVRNQDRSLNQTSVPTNRTFRDHKYSPKRTFVPTNQSNRSSTGSNIIPPPEDFESDTEPEEILRVESGSYINPGNNPNHKKERLSKGRDDALHTSIAIKNKEERQDSKPTPPKRYRINFHANISR